MEGAASIPSGLKVLLRQDMFRRRAFRPECVHPIADKAQAYAASATFAFGAFQRAISSARRVWALCRWASFTWP